IRNGHGQPAGVGLACLDAACGIATPYLVYNCNHSSSRKLGSSAMRPLHARSHRVSCFLSLLAACCFTLSAQTASVAAKSGNWSARSTWANGAVPAAGSIVSIPAGTNVVLDVSPPALNGLTIDGKLAFSNDKDLELTTEWIMLHGELEIGTEARPH